MPQVPAGNLTGLYYIVVAGLPWQCSWQRLKDFARDQQPDGSCTEIDHALVYPDSTSGWVRVKGIENFRNVMAHLNGGILDHRSIMADGRNETETLYIREDVSMPGSTAASLRHRGHSAAHDQALSPVAQYDHQTNLYPYSPSEIQSDWCYPAQYVPPDFAPLTPTITSPIYFQQPSSVYEQPNQILHQVDYSILPTAGIVYAGNIAPSTPVYIPPPQQIMAYMVPVPYAETQTIPIQHHALPTMLTVMKTEARKIIITSLPHSTTESALRNLLDKILTRTYTDVDPCQVIQDIEIVCHSNLKSRGYAFVVLETYHLAKSMVTAIDGLKFQNRQLSARFAKEGAQPCIQSMQSSSVPEQFYIPSSGADRRHPLTNGSSSKTNRSSRQAKGLSTKYQSAVPDAPWPSSLSESASSCSTRDGGSEMGNGSDGTKDVDPDMKRSDSFKAPLVVCSNGREHIK